MNSTLRTETDDPERSWTDAGVFEVAAGVFRIPLPLPMDALRAVNVYAVRDGAGLVLVDSGWALDAARDALAAALAALDCGFADVRRFLVTHVHRDHYTLAVALRREFGTRVSLGRGEAGTLAAVRDSRQAPWAVFAGLLRRGGADALAAGLEAGGAATTDLENWADPDDWLDAPGEIRLSDRTWQLHPTPGHTRGHVVFVDPVLDVMFAGDHVLPRITPSIGFEQLPAELPLGDYLDSLRLVAALPDRRLLPAHGPVAPSVHARVVELIDHHDTRLAQCQAAVGSGAGTAFEVANILRWTRRGTTFTDLDRFGQFLAVTETMAHLDVLVAAGRLRAAREGAASVYRSG